MIFQKVTFVEEGRNASSVDDFYYRGYEEKLKGKKGTGVRRVAADMIRDGKILERFLVLKNNGNSLEIYTIFRDKQSYDEFINHQLTKKSKDFWEEREWVKTVEMFDITDFLSVNSILSNLKPLNETLAES